MIWTATAGDDFIFSFDPKNISQPVYSSNMPADFANGFSCPVNSDGLCFIGGAGAIVFTYDINGLIINEKPSIEINECLYGVVRFISFDSFGNMAVTCNSDLKVVLYNSTGQFLNLQIFTSGPPEATAIDSKGRYIILDTYIEIFY